MGKETIDLSIHNEKIVKLNDEKNELQSKLNAKDVENISLKADNVKLKADIEKQKKESVHKKLFDSGKINKAQLDALNSGKTMLEVLALNEKTNLKPNGSGATPTETNLSSEEKEFAEQLGLTEQEWADGNK